jgi:hypothetical protein
MSINLSITTLPYPTPSGKSAEIYNVKQVICTYHRAFKGLKLFHLEDDSEP